MKLTLTLLAVLHLAPLALCAAESKPTTPNVVIFLVDDMGWGDLGCYGNKIIQSPNLDKFASQAMRFTQGYYTKGALVAGSHRSKRRNRLAGVDDFARDVMGQARRRSGERSSGDQALRP